MVQYNELCSINTCFSSNEVRGDNLGNCSVLNQNIAVICHGGVEFNEDVENGLNWKGLYRVQVDVIWKIALSKYYRKNLVHGSVYDD